MAQTALTQLQDQIEAIRREAYAAGYAAAMQAIRDFAARPAAVAAAPAAAPAQRRARAGRPARAAPAPRQRQPRAAAATPRTRAATARPQRGTNARLVEEVLQSNAPRALRPTEIRNTIRRDKGMAIAFTSIRHALNQLEERRTAEQVADSKTWRYRTPAS